MKGSNSMGPAAMSFFVFGLYMTGLGISLGGVGTQGRTDERAELGA